MCYKYTAVASVRAGRAMALPIIHDVNDIHNVLTNAREFPVLLLVDKTNGVARLMSKLLIGSAIASTQLSLYGCV